MNQYIEGTLYTPGNHILLVNPRLSVSAVIAGIPF